MIAKRAENLTTAALKKNGVAIDSGAQYSIKCQYAQIENTVNDAAEQFARDFLYYISESFNEDIIDGIKAEYMEYKNQAI